MGVLSIGQITITDLNDAKTASFYLTGNQSKVQIKNKENTYTPDFTNKNFEITPVLFLGANAHTITSDKIAYSCAYTDNTSAAGVGTKEGIIYKIGTNIPNGKTLVVTAVIQSITVDGMPYENLTATLEISCIASGVGEKGDNAKIFGIDVANGSTIFTNQNSEPIYLRPYFYDGSDMVLEGTSLQITWSRIPEGKVNVETEDATYAGCAKITRNDVDSAATIICTFKYINGDKTETYRASVPIYDKADPIIVTVFSTNGNIFKNGAGTTTLKAQLYDANGEVDDKGTGYNYEWTINDSTGTQTSWYYSETEDGYKGRTYKDGDAHQIAIGKTIFVGDKDISSKATISVSVSKI